MPQRKVNSELFTKVLTDANTEVEQELPIATKSLRFQARTSVSVRYAFETGRVATPTAPFMTLKPDDVYENTGLDLTVKGGVTATSIFLASASGGAIVEIETWR